MLDKEQLDEAMRDLSIYQRIPLDSYEDADQVQREAPVPTSIQTGNGRYWVVEETKKTKA